MSPPRLATRLILVLCMVLLGAYLASHVLVGGQYGAAEFVISAVGILLLLAYTWVTLRAHAATHPMPESSSPLRYHDAEGLEYLFSTHGEGELSFAHAAAFIDPIVYPKDVFERISEFAQPYHRSLMLSTSYVVALHREVDPDDQPDFAVPLFLFPKGTVQDGLRVYRNESRVSTLSTCDVLTMSFAVLRSLFYAAGTHAYTAYLQTLEADIIELVSSFRAPADQKIHEIRLRILALASPGGYELLSTASALVDQLSRHHAVCATIQADEMRAREWPWTFRFKLEYRLIPPLLPLGKEPWWRRLGDAIRLALGVRLNRIFMPIPNAYRTTSYHLQVSGPEGTYLARQGTIPPVERLDIRAVIQPRRGQRRAHAYIQHLDYDGEVLFATQFFERAPGSFATTTASAWAAWVVVGAIALREQIASEEPFSFLLPALLAVPIAVASWNRGNARALEHPSLLSRGLTFLNILLCLVVFVAAIVPATLVAIPGIVWNSFASVALALALVSTFAWVLRLAVEHRFIRSGGAARSTQQLEGD